MNSFVVVGTVMLLLALYLLFRKYRIVFGGEKRTTTVCAVVSKHVSCNQHWYLVKRYTVEICGKELNIIFDPMMIKQYKVGDSCTVFHKNGRVTFARSFGLELLAIVFLLLGASFLSVGLKIW